MGGSGGYRRLPGGSDDFLLQTDKQTLHHYIYIIIVSSPMTKCCKERWSGRKWGRGRDRGAVPTWFTNTLLPPTLRLGEIISGISYPPLFLVTDTFAKSVHSILSKCDTFTPIKRIYLSLLLSLSLCSSLPCESRPGESGN